MSTASSSLDGIQLLDESPSPNGMVGSSRHSLPRPLPLQVVRERSWATSCLFINIQKRQRTEWTSITDLNWISITATRGSISDHSPYSSSAMDRVDKSPSLDSGRGTSNSNRLDRHKRCFTNDNMDSSSTTSSIKSFQNERSDSETVVSALETDKEASPLKKTSSLPAFMRKSKPKKPVMEEGPSPSKGFKRFTTGRTSLFQKKSQAEASSKPVPIVRDFKTLEEEAQLGSSVSPGAKAKSLCRLTPTKNVQKPISVSTSSTASSAKDKDKERKISPVKKSSFVKGFAKFIKGASSSTATAKGPATAAAASLPAMEILAEGTSGSQQLFADLVLLSHEPRRIEPTAKPKPPVVVQDVDEVLTRVKYSMDVGSTTDPDAANHAAILDSQILKQLQEEQEAKDKNSLEIKKLRRKKKNKARTERQESESDPNTTRAVLNKLEKPQLEFETENSPEVQDEIPAPEESLNPLEPIVYLSETEVVYQKDASSDPLAEDRDTDEGTAIDVDPNVDADEEPSIYQHDPARRRSSGPLTDSFKQLEPFNFGLESIIEGKRERLYKVLVVGELGTGKTSIIKRYVHQFFSQHYRATIGVDFALKVLRWDPETVVRLQLWDIAGQERFGSMTRVYYKEAVGAFVVFDVTRGATLEAVPKWKADLDSKVVLPDGRPIPTVLLANKSDQPKEGIAAHREKMNEFCQQQGFSAWFETSAKDNINIDESANFLVSKILEMDKWSQEPSSSDPEKVDLNGTKGRNGVSSNCAC